MAALSAASTLKLNDGTVIPRIGFGVYQIRGKKCAAAARINHEALLFIMVAWDRSLRAS